MTERNKFKEIRIETIEDARKYLFFDQPYNDKLGRNRKLYLYRGLPDVSFELKTSLQRNCKSSKSKLEKLILENFGKYAQMEMQSMTDTIWTKMIIGQHHGLPTRLLDWTRSPLTALHFATTEGNMDMLDQHDCVIWRIDVDAINKRLPYTYKQVCKEFHQEIFTLPMLNKVCKTLEEYDRDMKTADAMVIMEPPTIDQRIANQFSYFSIVPDHVQRVEDILINYADDSVTKIVIDKNLRWEIRDMLDQANISERLIYPGLDGIAKWLGRYYFVRNITKLHIVTKSITTANVDMIACSLMPGMDHGSGAVHAVFEQGGLKLEQALKKAMKAEHRKNPGEIVYLEDTGLAVKEVALAVCDMWKNMKETDAEALVYNHYTNILEHAKEKQYKSVGVALLCAGSANAPLETVWRIALQACKDFLDKNQGQPMDITFCVFDAENEQIGKRIYKELFANKE